MKTKYMAMAALMAGASLLSFSSCNDFLDYHPTAVVDEDKAFSDPNSMTTAAYAALGNDWYQYPFNLWPYGDLTSDDCLKGGGGTTDTDYHALEVWSSLTPTLGPLDELWYRLYVSISRCNRALLSLEQHGEEKLGKEVAAQRAAEVRFLRAHFYYKLVSVFHQVPWIDEVVYREHKQETVPNNAFSYEELMGKVIADFEVAYNTLPEEQTDKGRANKVAAAAYLAKCHLALAWGNGYEDKTGVNHLNATHLQKVVDYTDVVAKSKYGYLEDFGDLFLPEHDNNKESIFAVQHSGYEDDNTTFGRANWSNTLNGCWGIWSCGWDFHKPSQDLVDAFKTKNGLPMFDDYHATPQHPVNGTPTAQKWDPRLFHTVGMPSFPYKYEATQIMTKNNSRTPNTYGFYTSLKEVTQRSKGETYNYPWQAFAKNEYVFRFTDVMLMRAEALVELGRLEEARTIINDIRQRAANSVSKHIAYAADQCEIAPYPATYFADKASARQCLRWERRLEMAMEHERFFDLRRWGVASTTLNTYFQRAAKSNYEGQDYAQYYKDAKFTTGKNEFFPIPYNQMFYIPGLYVQNAGYK